MKSVASILRIKWIKVLWVLGILYSLIVAAYLLVETGKPLGSRDFHQFWYAGHFIIQNQDPYEAFFTGKKPDLPIHYLDGVTVTRYPVAQEDLEITPSNTPAMLLILTPLSYLSWATAKWIFLVVYFDFSATRIAIENGQTTLFVFLLMMLSLIFSRQAWYLSGITLGLALSKYSLSIPIFLFFLYKKNYKVLLLAIAVQLAGVLGLAVMSEGMPLKILEENLLLFFRLFDQPGVHLSRWFEFMFDNHFLTLIPSLVMTFLVFLLMFLWVQKKPPATAQQEEVVDFHVLNILFIWALLVAYHRLYDTLILIFFFILISKGLTYPGLWRLSISGQRALLAFMALTPFILILPARIVDLLVPFYYGRVSDAITTLLLVIMLGISMFLLWRYLQNMQVKTIHKETESNELRNDPYRDSRQRWAHHS